jgi:tripartite-type tricarboxylate transporter receptor subunit TctC
VEKWDDLLKSAAASASVKSAISKLGLSPSYLPASQFQAFIFGQYTLLKSETKIIPPLVG